MEWHYSRCYDVFYTMFIHCEHHHYVMHTPLHCLTEHKREVLQKELLTEGIYSLELWTVLVSEHDGSSRLWVDFHTYVLKKIQLSSTCHQKRCVRKASRDLHFYLTLAKFSCLNGRLLIFLHIQRFTCWMGEIRSDHKADKDVRELRIIIQIIISRHTSHLNAWCKWGSTV